MLLCWVWWVIYYNIMLICQWMIGVISEIPHNFLSSREPLHVIWYYCTWWTRAPTTERRSLKSSTLSMTVTRAVMTDLFKSINFCQSVFQNLDLDIGTSLRKDRTKLKDGKTGHREKRSRKPGADKGAANSSKKPEEAEPALESSPTAEGQRGPTIPRNTGQRYSAVLSTQGGGEPKHHITFSSLN